MRITLLGTGTPVLDPQRQHSALVIDIGGEILLFDAGRGVTSQLLGAGILPQHIQSVFLTHHHYDHIGNLGEFLLTAWHNGQTTSITVYGPPGTAEIVRALLEQVYARDIAFALLNNPETVDIKRVVQVQEITPGLVCDTGVYRVFAEYVDHGNSLGLSREDWSCFGYRIEVEGKAIAISGDTVDCEGLDRLAHGADCLVQCCYLADAELSTPALKRLGTHVIASSGQVGLIAARNEVKHLVLTHIRPKSQALMQSMLEDIHRAYHGEIRIGEDLMVIDV